MDNKEKIRILKEMRELISNETEDFFCPAYARVTRNKCNYKWVTEQMLSEIGLYKPVIMYDIERNFWYDRDDRQTRLTKIDEAITKFENEIKTEMNTNKFCVKVHNKYLSEAVQKLAFDNGYKWVYGKPEISQTDKPYLFFYLNEKDITWDNSDNHSTTYDALTDWRKIEQAMKPREPRTIWINEYNGYLANGVYASEEIARNMDNTAKHIKFQEVIE